MNKNIVKKYSGRGNEATMYYYSSIYMPTQSSEYSGYDIIYVSNINTFFRIEFNDYTRGYDIDFSPDLSRLIRSNWITFNIGLEYDYISDYYDEVIKEIGDIFDEWKDSR